MADKRGKDSPTSMRVKLKVATVDSFVEKFAANVNRSGMFLSSKSPKAVGTTLRFELLSNDGKVKLLKGEALVAWVRDDGMGLRFKKLDGESRKLVDRMVARKRAMGEVTGETVPVPPPPDEAKAEEEAKADETAKADEAAKPDEAKAESPEAGAEVAKAAEESSPAPSEGAEEEARSVAASEASASTSQEGAAESTPATPSADEPRILSPADDVEAFLAADGPALLETLERARTIARALMANGGALGMDELDRLLAPGDGISVTIDDASASLATAVGGAPVLRQPMKPIIVVAEPVPVPVPVPVEEPVPVISTEPATAFETVPPTAEARAADVGEWSPVATEPPPFDAEPLPAVVTSGPAAEAALSALARGVAEALPEPTEDSAKAVAPPSEPVADGIPEAVPEQHSEVIPRAATDAIAEGIPTAPVDALADTEAPSITSPNPLVSEAMTEEDRWGALPELPDESGLDATTHTPPMGTSPFDDEGSGGVLPQDFDTDPPGTGYASSDPLDELGENTRETSVADMMDMMEVDVLEDAGELAEELGARDLDATELERITSAQSTPGSQVDLEESVTLAMAAQKTSLPERSSALDRARKAPIRELPAETFDVVEELDLNDASLGIEVELEEDPAAAERDSAAASSAAKPPPPDEPPPRRGGFFKKLFGK